jgi:tetratricopeptide (TPR) repeat protein
MYTQKHLILFGLIFTFTPSFVMANDYSAASTVIVNQAQFWQSKGDYVRAAESWKKLLMLDPNDLRGINGLAYLEQEKSLQNDSDKKALLKSARSLAKSGDVDMAISKYNAALGDKPPMGDAISLEYYSNLGYTANGFETAKQGLIKLETQSPNNPLIKLALGKLLINEANSRVEGIRILSGIATNEIVGVEATESWQKALGWIGVPNSKQVSLFQDYLKLNPGDTEIRSQLNSMVKSSQIKRSASDTKMPVQDFLATTAFNSGKRALAEGDDVAARAEFEKSLSFDENNPWVRLALARLYSKDGESNLANDLMHNMVYLDSNQTEALYAAALFNADLGDWVRTLDLLDQIPPKNRTPAIIELQKRSWVQNQVSLSSAMTKKGRQQEALSILAKTRLKIGNDADMLVIVAGAYVDAGDLQHGIDLFRQRMAVSARPSETLKLQYAGVLLKASRDKDFAYILRQINLTKLNPVEHNTFDELLFTFSLRQADALRLQGDLAASYEVLRPLLDQNPNNTACVNLLAQLYLDSGDNAQALEIHKQLVQNNPDNVEIKLNGARVALNLQDKEYANSLIEQMLADSPDRLDILTAAARIYRDQGQSSRAKQLYEHALEIDQLSTRSKITRKVSSEDNSEVFSNPFAGINSNKAIAINPPAREMLAYNDYQSPNINQAKLTTYKKPSALARNQIQRTISDESLQQNDRDDTLAFNSRYDGNLDPVAYSSKIKSVPKRTSYTNENIVTIPNSVNANLSGKFNMMPVSKYTYNNFSLPNDNRAKPQAIAKSTVLAQLPLAKIIDTELSQIKQEIGPEVLFGAQIRNRKGTAGQSQLTDIETPLEVRFPIGDGKANVQITPVTLDAGKLGGDYYSKSSFGGGPQSALSQIVDPNTSQTATGVGMSVGYKFKGLAVDVGVTPAGFNYSNFTGGLKFESTIDDAKTLSYQVNLSSRPVTDSFLSFAGATDNRTGQTWGGVMASGVRLQITKDLGDYGVLASASYHGLSGHNVSSNSRVEFMGGAYLDLIKTPDSILSSGINISNSYYQKNLSGFTYGNGGYFSPQQYYSLAIPLNWSQRSDKLTYQVRGSLGVQHFTQDAANYFPDNDSLQLQADVASANAVTLGLTGNSKAIYSGQTTTSAVYNIAAGVEYQFTPKLFLGVNSQADNASNYSQFNAGVYMRYSMDGINVPMALPVKSYLSP